MEETLGRSEASLAWWLLGLTNKTAQNLGVRQAERFDYLKEVVAHIQSVTDSSPELDFDDAMLMVWAGAATLTIRGARKSTVGKTLERAFLRAGLSMLGLETISKLFAQADGRRTQSPSPLRERAGVRVKFLRSGFEIVT